MKIAPFGDEALEISQLACADARAIAAAVRGVAAVREVVVGDGAILALFCDRVRPASLEEVRRALAHLEPAASLPTPKLHVVRAVYDGADRHVVAEACGLDLATLAARHAAAMYTVEVIGFLPGFAYLGGLDPQLVVPRRATPRPRVLRGAIGIAGARTAIYPLESPGGWSLVARALDFTPFDPRRDPPSPFAIGDRVRFVVEEIVA